MDWKKMLVLMTVAMLLVSVVHAAEMPREETLIVRMSAKQAASDVYNPFLPGYQGHMIGNEWNAEHLFYVNMYSGKIIPWLATGFEYNQTFDAITVHIRQGVKWNDGEPFTARDVVFSYNMLKGNAKLMGSGWISKWFKEVTLVDDYTVSITLTSPEPRAHYSFLYAQNPPAIVPEHIWSKVDPATFKNYPNPVWTGPYKLVESTAEKVIWERRDDYWGKEIMGKFPGPKYLLVTGGAPEKMMMEQIEHRMDVWSEFTKSQAETIAKKNKDVVVWPAHDPCTRAVWFNLLNTPINSAKVRWAISYALDKKKMSMVAYENVNPPTSVPYPYYGTILPYVEDWKDLIEKYNVETYDPQKALALLEEQGYKRDKDGKLIGADGKQLALTIVAPPWTGQRETAMSVADDLKAIGIDASWKVLEPGPFGNAWNRAQDYDLLTAWACSPNQAHTWDPYAMLEQFHSYWIVPQGQQSQRNPSRYNNPAFDQIVDQLTAISPDDPAAKAALKQGMEIFLQDLPMLPTLQTMMIQTLDTKYWKNFPTSENPYVTPFHWWPQFLFVLLELQPA